MSTEAPLIIRGMGAVSAAGWGVAQLVAAMEEGVALPVTLLPQPGGASAIDVGARLVPPMPADRLPKHNRLRRASNVTRFAMAAALEAVGENTSASLGIIVCVMNGCVAFTNRFYQEVLRDPALASPILFPETVFNAPASHIACYLEARGPVTTLIGEPNIIAEALRTARYWMTSGHADQCLVIGAEEADWMSALGVRCYDKRMVVSEGAGALLVGLDGDGPQIRQVAGPFAYHNNKERTEALKLLATAMACPGAGLLINHAQGIARCDRQEAEAWASVWKDAVRSPRQLLGEGMGISAALQLVLAGAFAQTERRNVMVSMPGYNTAAYGCLVSPPPERNLRV